MTGAVRAAAIGLAVAGNALVPAHAHEFWIQPDRFTVAPRESVAIGLRVGAGWPGEPFALQRRRVVGFAWIDALGERAIEGEDGDEPAGRVTATVGGTAIAVYRSNDAVADLDAATFETYLREEGLGHASAARAARRLASAPVRERYSRCAKAIMTVSGGDGTLRGGAARDRDDAARAPGGAVLVTRPIGLDFEIVPRVDPRRLAAGGALPVRVTWLGEPAPGLLVKALPQSDPSLRIEARTDAAGRATLQLPAGSVWLVNAVRIEPAPAGSGFDWQSTWSSLTFEALRPPQRGRDAGARPPPGRRGPPASSRTSPARGSAPSAPSAR